MQRTPSLARRAGGRLRTPFQAAVAAVLMMAATLPALAGDGQAPSTSVDTPRTHESMPAGTVTFAGKATDDSGVTAVRVAIQNRGTKDWWRADGSWGRFERHDAVLASPGAATTGWTFAWPAPPGAGDYGALVEAVDAAGNRDPNRPWVPFSVAPGPAPVPQPPDGTITPLRRAAPTYMGGSPSLTLAEARDIAAHHDVVISLHHTFAPHLAAMRSLNPELEVFVYVNGMFSFPGGSYPESAYAHNEHGDRITSSFGNFLMEPSSAKWHGVVSGKCAAALAIAAYDGCFLDNMGTGPIVPGYLSDVPVRPGTGQPYNRSEWMALNVATVDAVLAANPGARVSANGLGNGDRYFASQYSTGDLFDAVDVAMAEIWLREPKAAVSKYRSEASWRRDVDMIVDAEARGKSVVAVTKLWTSATTAQERTWHRYALASFLLASNGASSFAFSAAKSFAGVTAPSPWQIEIGEAQGPYTLRDGAYQRAFASGLVVVNPSDRTVTVPLPGTFRDLDGTERSSVTLAPHTGEVLTR